MKTEDKESLRITFGYWRRQFLNRTHLLSAVLNKDIKSKHNVFNVWKKNIFKQKFLETLKSHFKIPFDQYIT